ncbi:MAG TPA: MOSC domain-containing protein, partial [Burkholderiales bacterium]|nr:MOSC domain-containing protein [Burkholderiales bacterium]
IAPAIDAGMLRVSAPGRTALVVRLDSIAQRAAERQVKVWTHECLAFDEGEEAATWFSGFLGHPSRLVRFDPAHRRVSSPEWTGGVQALNRFSDGYPVLLISQASLDDLNDRLAEAGREALPMNRFRPNIVLGGVGPYEEDYMLTLAATGIVFKPVKPCPRCPVPSIDQSTGVPGPDPLDILSQYRSDERTGGVIFGQNLIALEGAGKLLKVGLELTPEWNF